MTDHPDGYPQQKCLRCGQVRQATLADTCPCRRGDAMTTPKRIWRRRTKGWRMPPNTVYVGRPTKWGNPFEAYRCPCCKSWDVQDDNGVTYLVDHAQARRVGPKVPQSLAVSHAVRLFRKDFEWGSSITVEEVIAELAGKNLACWCPPVDYTGAPWPCHADVLLDIANGAP